MNIKEKIKEINSQPENVRMRYVWGCVAVSMLVIFVVWIFSIVSMFSGRKNISEDNSGMANIQEQLNNIKEQAPSLKSLGEQPLNIGAGESPAKQNSNSSQETIPNNTATEIPQSETYSKLPVATPQQ